ncbi:MULTISPECIES: lysophospholipid acyltransferase family protein [Pacificibacter]|uniref:lysophospholipid acyltransferase family protein n=1 Tax=Pacificibacter TaxID=1042323 RepID=UPI001C08BC29|nr:MULTISPECIES: 1-acyl-sn-glycerol-3-phosphate acyltransferase [Pacificibacter]MBU2934913.1 1-acyl-sn-glycerol-3-phosphate acyltransferase [Pacificibacter marinus]MDO6616267.1 1-acyl-sn-glycerol-3-phosphate acyltransferase [Pacificibacter sp. 1_MG-2023]
MTSPLWNSSVPPVEPPCERFDGLRAVLRGAPIVLLILVCLPLMMLTRGIERLIVGARRPWSSVFPRFVSYAALKIMGIPLQTRGTPMSAPGAVVANHSSWLDIFTLNACQDVFFVSKDEVANWAGIGPLARACGTVFIARDRKEAGRQKILFEKRLHMGHKLLFFPEGTSTDGLRVLPFKPTLFAAFFAPELRDEVSIQPVTVQYIAPAGADPRFYGWWGEMEFAPSLIKFLKARKQGAIMVTFHEPIAVKDVPNRKDMAFLCEKAVRSGLPEIAEKFKDV